MNIYVPGHTGFVGKAVVNALSKTDAHIITASHSDIDLKDYRSTLTFIKETRPDCIVNCAAIVGGIKANMADPYKFLFDNLQIQNSLIDSAMRCKIKKFVFLGSSCVYPKDYKQPLKEEYLLKDIPEPTNEGYSIAKISGLKLCEYANKTQKDTQFISLMPCNLYGPGDTFDLERSHVLSALVKRISLAKKIGANVVEIWGTGDQRREFLYIEDLADAILWSISNLTNIDGFVNVGTGEDISIKELAFKIAKVVGYEGNFVFDTSKPDGMKKKCLDVSKINNLGWRAKTSFDEGLAKTIEFFERS